LLWSFVNLDRLFRCHRQSTNAPNYLAEIVFLDCCLQGDDEVASASTGSILRCLGYLNVQQIEKAHAGFLELYEPLPKRQRNWFCWADAPQSMLRCRLL
jgi:hypothetical protein